MKTMTCEELGGSCDESFKGATPQEILRKAEEHMKKAHNGQKPNISEEDLKKRWSSLTEA